MTPSQKPHKASQGGWPGRKAVAHGLSDNYVIWRIHGRTQEYTLAKRTNWAKDRHVALRNNYVVLKFGTSIEGLEASVNV